MRLIKNMYLFSFFIWSSFLISLQTYGEEIHKSFIVAIPLRVGTPYRFEYNLGKGSLGLDLLKENVRERLGDKEIQQQPGDSLISEAKEISIMFSRYGNAELLSGLHWGLGIGYRAENMAWRKNLNLETKEDLEFLVDQDGKVYHAAKLDGITGSVRLGYRYVSQSAGFVAGLFVVYKHFESKVNDVASQGIVYPFSKMPKEDLQTLRNKLMTSIMPGLEIGWAF